MDSAAPTGFVGWITIILTLVYLEGILSIDNAAVLGAMVAPLPAHERVPWPRPLRFLGGVTWRVLGGQRLAALKVGLLGAYVGRGSMLFAATYIVQNPWLRLVGALYLIKLASEHLAEPDREPAHGPGESGAPVRQRSRSFWSVVLGVELADLAFSLDNVVAAVALSRNLLVVMTGVFLGIVTMRFAAGIFARLILRYPVLEAAAYVLVFNIGMELILEEYTPIHVSEFATFSISLGTILLAVGYERNPLLNRLGRRLRFLRWIMVAIHQVYVVALWPLAAAYRLALSALRRPSSAAAPER